MARCGIYHNGSPLRIVQNSNFTAAIHIALTSLPLGNLNNLYAISIGVRALSYTALSVIKSSGTIGIHITCTDVQAINDQVYRIGLQKTSYMAYGYYSHAVFTQSAKCKCPALDLHAFSL